MPEEKPSKCVYRSRLSKAQEAVFWHNQRSSPGVAITARDRAAVQQGKQVTVQVRQQEDPSRRSS